MYFDLSDDQAQLRDAVARVVTDTADLQSLTGGADAVADVQARLAAQLREMGTAAILVPADKGGLGMDLLSLCLVADVLAGCAAPGHAVQTALAAWLLAKSEDATAARQLEAILAGEMTAAFAIAEPGSLWFPDQWKDGPAPVSKTHVQGADSADLVLACVPGDVVLLDRTQLSIAPPTQAPLDPSRPLSTIRFDPRDGIRLGAHPARLFDALLILTAASAIGAGHKAFRMAVDYAGTREQFGRPIGSFQGLKHQLANMATDIEPARFLYWYAAHAWDSIPDAVPRAALMAKAHCCDVAVKTARASVEAHGGIGYTWEYPLHLLLKRAMQDRATFGSSMAARSRAALLPA